MTAAPYETDEKRLRREAKIEKYARDLLEDARKHRVQLTVAEALYKARDAYRPQNDEERPARRRTKAARARLDNFPEQLWKPAVSAKAHQLTLPFEAQRASA